jgi:shikimate kinase
MKVFLVGMPGSGKSTLGKQLARKLGLAFVDLDHEIEKAENQRITEIFSNRGEDFFRQVESSFLKRWASSPEDFVMATGGGAPCFHKGMEVINNAGVSIFLNVTPNELLSRTSKNIERPLLKGGAEEKLTALYEKRLPVYSRATHIVSGDNIEIGKILDALNIKK